MNTKKFLSALHKAESFEAIDAEFCRFLLQQHPNLEEAVLLAAAFTSRTYREGNVCLQLGDVAGQDIFNELRFTPKIPSLDDWLTMLRESPPVGQAGDFTPLTLDQNRLYLNKLWQYEQNLAKQLLDKSTRANPQINQKVLSEGLHRLFKHSTETLDLQQLAAVQALHNNFTVISGGPGTGKTTIIIRLLVLMIEQGHAFGTSPAIAMAAPTGKAAARMEKSILDARSSLDIRDSIKEAIPDEAVTIHQLLGARRHSSTFRYNSENPLPYDVVIIDEASMIDQVLMSKLVGALLEKTKLILLGDKDQLASVEAGAVLGDICGNQPQNYISRERAEAFKALNTPIPDDHITDQPAPLTDNVVLLKKSYRFDKDSSIGRLARSINAGRAEETNAILQDEKFDDAERVTVDSHTQFRGMMAQIITPYIKVVPEHKSIEEAFRAFNTNQILAAHRRGPWGVNVINSSIEATLRKQKFIPPFEQWYPGKPIIINRNDYALDLNNGDLGICLADDEGELVVYFEQEQMTRGIEPSRLPDFSPAYALTIHKSQGSEFENVSIVLPEEASKILSRELLYTAVTRAKKSVKIVGRPEMVTQAVNRKLARNSGLANLLWNE
jgi:exodeoxyribonuclease V alpha subunit